MHEIAHAPRSAWKDHQTDYGSERAVVPLILVMKVIGEMNSFQIGHALQIPAGTIRYKMAKVRRLLAEQMGMLQDGTAQERRQPNG